MDQLISHKHKIDFLLSNDNQEIQCSGWKLCHECKKKRKIYDETHQICQTCYKAKSIYKPSGNMVIDDFIRYILINGNKFTGKMEFIPYDQFKDIIFIGEGGFSKIYKATWIDGPIYNWSKKKQSYVRTKSNHNYPVVLKRINNSKDITSQELNELRMFYEFSLKSEKIYDNYNHISKYFGITQDPISQDIMIIMPYYYSGDLISYITSNFHSISWKIKLVDLRDIIKGLISIHHVNIVHRDLHSGNIFFGKVGLVIGDLGINKSATEFTIDNNKIYGIIPYMAPEIFYEQKYTKSSDVYSFGMIMWEFMTGRRPFWDRAHDSELIIDICNGLRPPINTNTPQGYIDLMKECWHPDPNKRPSAIDIYERIERICLIEVETKIITSQDIGPVTINPGAIYSSRYLSNLIQYAMYLRNSRNNKLNDNIVSNGKRKLEDDDSNGLLDNDNDQSIKRKRFSENENGVSTNDGKD